jgi:hypothetical protein
MPKPLYGGCETLLAKVPSYVIGAAMGVLLIVVSNSDGAPLVAAISLGPPLVVICTPSLLFMGYKNSLSAAVSFALSCSLSAGIVFAVAHTVETLLALYVAFSAFLVALLISPLLILRGPTRP